MIHVVADASEVAQVLAAANADHRALCVRAGDSKASWCAPGESAATLDVSQLRGILDYEPTELILTARAATPLHEIEAVLEAHQQMLAFEPPDWRALLRTVDRHQTLGGVIACNLSGSRRVTAGAARDHFLGVQAVSGRGDIFKAGGKVVKNVTGYDLCKVLAGSYGTLAVMTELTVKALPRPEYSVSIVRFGLSDAEALRFMIDALNSGHEVSAAAHLPQAAAPDAIATTLLRVEGSNASVQARQDALCRELSGEFLDSAQSEQRWMDIRNVTSFAAGNAPVWRLSIPAASAHRITTAIGQSLPCRWFFDWGGALVWLCVDSEIEDAGAQIIRDAIATDGHATLLRASAAVRATAAFQPLSTPLHALNARVKQAFDPAGILNPAWLNANP